MSPEERSLLQNTHELAEQNNRILRSLQRSNRISTLVTILYWLVIIGLSVGAFYFVQPYIKFLTDLSGQQNSSLGEKIEALFDNSSTNKVQNNQVSK